MKNLHQKDFANAYLRAEKSFKRWIHPNHSNYQDLQEEMRIPLQTIKTKPEFIKIEVHEYDDEPYVIRTVLTLYDENEDYIGYYALVEDSYGETIDDFLIF